jgi:hypothetical protein
MADTILIKRSNTPGSIPTTSSLQQGELALNIPDRLLYTVSGSEVVTLNNSGSYNVSQLDLVTDGTVITITGSMLTNIFSETAAVHPPLPSTRFSGASIDYNAQRQGAARFGTIMASWSGSSIVYTDNSTADVGETTDLSFNFVKIGDDINLRAYSEGLGTGTWNVSFIITLFPKLL